MSHLGLGNAPKRKGPNEKSELPPLEETAVFI